MLIIAFKIFNDHIKLSNHKSNKGNSILCLRLYTCLRLYISDKHIKVFSAHSFLLPPDKT